VAPSITWLGHAAFRFDLPSGARVYVDPFLTGNPSCPASELEPDRLDAILLTHGHSDHVGDTVRLARAFACPVIAQVELRGLLGEEIGADMAQAVNKGGSVNLLGARVTLTHANHSSSYEGTYTGESCGFVVEAPDLPTIYFAGDTNVFGDMALIRRIYAPEIAVLPIGDHFTMGPREAAVAADEPTHVIVSAVEEGTCGTAPEELRRAAAEAAGTARTVVVVQPGDVTTPAALSGVDAVLVEPARLLGPPGTLEQPCQWWDDCPPSGQIAVRDETGGLSFAGTTRVARMTTAALR